MIPAHVEHAGFAVLRTLGAALTHILAHSYKSRCAQNHGSDAYGVRKKEAQFQHVPNIKVRE